MRRRRSESARLRSMMPVCSCSSPCNCAIAYPEYTAVADKITARPASSRAVGDAGERLMAIAGILARAALIGELLVGLYYCLWQPLSLPSYDKVLHENTGI